MKPKSFVATIHIAILLVILALEWRSVFMMSDILFGKDYSLGRHIFSAVAVTVLAVPTALYAQRLLDRRALSLIFGPGSKPITRFLFGMGCWLVPAVIALGIGSLMGWITVTPVVPTKDILLRVGALLCLVFLYEALPEELVFRGYFYQKIVRTLPASKTIVLQALLFTIFGVLIGAAASVDRVILLFTFAVVLGLFRATTGSIWAGMGFHLAFQVVAQLTSVATYFTIENLSMVQICAWVILPFTSTVVLLSLMRHKRGITLEKREP